MRWRPYITVGFLGLAALANGALLWSEEMDMNLKDDDIKQVDEQLKTLFYSANQRRTNFMIMGMTSELAEETATAAKGLMKSKERFLAQLQEQALDVSPHFCASDGLPQPYKALEMLIREENGRREVIDSSALLRFDAQPWFLASPVERVYDKFERVTDRRGDATIMAVSSILLSREADALNGRSPWSSGLVGVGGFRTLNQQNPTAKPMVVRYFALMHVLVELANGKGGICGNPT